ncbi:hypothetical protein VTP01DRAFT_2015 [Rhizomucor pusillus]|uniref:uncharacterized protein n=1 Tax=Rhizomucor pusillus TaxID=4840 RepID=UPI0037422660
MALYFYKGYDGDLQYFIKCEWVNDVDYTVDQDPELPICNLTLTTLKEFWLGTVTRKELQSFLKKGREPDKLTEVVTVALQGDTKYQDNDLKWRLKADGEGGGECEVALHVYLDGKLPLILGKFHIPKLDNSKRDEYLKIWMEAVVVQNAKSKEIRRAVLERNQDLVELKSTLEKRLDDIVSEKVDAEINLLLKA